jgi:hypothetical protein
MDVQLQQEQNNVTMNMDDSLDDNNSNNNQTFDTTSLENTPMGSILQAASDESIQKVFHEETGNLERYYVSSASEVSTPMAKVPPERGSTEDSYSLSGSLESIDSLVDSYWDPVDDGASENTPVISNAAAYPAKNKHVRSNAAATDPTQNNAVFYEHVRFLRVRTKPRRVEIVWSSDDPKHQQKNT